MSVKLNIYYIDLTDAEASILEDDIESVNGEMYLKIPDDTHALWYLLNELLKVNSRRLFDLILTAHIRHAVYRDNLVTTRLTHALKLGE